MKILVSKIKVSLFTLDLSVIFMLSCKTTSPAMKIGSERAKIDRIDQHSMKSQ